MADRLTSVAQGIANAAGVTTIVSEGPIVGEYWLVTPAVISGPQRVSAVTTVTLRSLPYSVFSGSVGQGGPFVLGAGEKLTVTITGMTQGDQTTLALWGFRVGADELPFERWAQGTAALVGGSMTGGFVGLHELSGPEHSGDLVGRQVFYPTDTALAQRAQLTSLGASTFDMLFFGNGDASAPVQIRTQIVSQSANIALFAERAGHSAEVLVEALDTVVPAEPRIAFSFVTLSAATPSAQFLIASDIPYLVGAAVDARAAPAPGVTIPQWVVPAAKAIKGATQSITTNNQTVVTFSGTTGEGYDNDSMFNNANDTLVASRDGKYAGVAHIDVDTVGTAATEIIVRIRKNGASFQAERVPATAGGATSLSVPFEVELAAADTIDVTVQFSSATGNSTIGTDSYLAMHMFSTA